MCPCLLHRGDAVSEGAQGMRRKGRVCPKGSKGGTAGCRDLPCQHQNDTLGFVGSVCPSEAASFEDGKENTVLQSL